MNQLQKVKNLVRTLVNCSSEDAEKASQAICRDPETLILLGTACALSTNTAFQGVTATKASAAVQAWPAVIAGLTITGASTLAAKRFCTAVIQQGGAAINNQSKAILKDSL